MSLAPRLASLPRRELNGGLTLVEATTLRSRARGLGGLTQLDPDDGLIIPAGSIHTFTMRVALDLIWLSRDGTVRRVDRDVAPRRIRICPGARRVIEVPAGRADAFLAAGAAGTAGGLGPTPA